jgi:hypothetical protein
MDLFVVSAAQGMFATLVMMLVTRHAGMKQIQSTVDCLTL